MSFQKILNAFEIFFGIPGLWGFLGLAITLGVFSTMLDVQMARKVKEEERQELLKHNKKLVAAGLPPVSSLPKVNVLELLEAKFDVFLRVDKFDMKFVSDHIKNYLYASVLMGIGGIAIKYGGITMLTGWFTFFAGVTFGFFNAAHMQHAFAQMRIKGWVKILLSVINVLFAGLILITASAESYGKFGHSSIQQSAKVATSQSPTNCVHNP